MERKNVKSRASSVSPWIPSVSVERRLNGESAAWLVGCLPEKDYGRSIWHYIDPDASLARTADPWPQLKLRCGGASCHAHQLSQAEETRWRLTLTAQFVAPASRPTGTVCLAGNVLATGTLTEILTQESVNTVRGAPYHYVHRTSCLVDTSIVSGCQACGHGSIRYEISSVGTCRRRVPGPGRCHHWQVVDFACFNCAARATYELFRAQCARGECRPLALLRTCSLFSRNLRPAVERCTDREELQLLSSVIPQLSGRTNYVPVADIWLLHVHRVRRRAIETWLRTVCFVACTDVVELVLEYWTIEWGMEAGTHESGCDCQTCSEHPSFL